MLEYILKKRKVFYSFEYKPDSSRVQQVINMGSVSGDKLLNTNEWEEVKKGGDPAIKKWIDDNMKNKSCVVVLIGNTTANKKWVQYEIEKGWNDGKGLVGVYIHNLECMRNGYCNKGLNPFSQFIIKDGMVKKDLNDHTSPFSRLLFKTENLANVVKCYDPPVDSFEILLGLKTKGQVAYKYIEENIKDWVEIAINNRNQYNNTTFFTLI